MKTIEQIIALANNTLVSLNILDEDMRQETYLWVVQNYAKLKGKTKEKICYYIEKFINRMMLNEQQLNINVYTYDITSNSDVLYEKMLLRQELYKAINSLNEEQKYIILHKYGINCVPQSILEISKHFRKPVSYSQKVEEEALKKIQSLIDFSII